MGDKFTEFMDLGGEVMEHFDVKKAKKKLKEAADDAAEKTTLGRAAKKANKAAEKTTLERATKKAEKAAEKTASERRYQEYLKNMQGEKEAYYRQNSKRLMKEQDLSDQYYNQKNAYLRDKYQHEQKQAAQNRIANDMAENPGRRRQQIRNKMAKENRVNHIAFAKRKLNEPVLEKLKIPREDGG